MSEKLHPKHHEQAKNNRHEQSGHHERVRDHIEKEAARANHEHADKVEHIRSKVEQTAQTKHEYKTTSHDAHEASAGHHTYINKELKSAAYQRTLKKTQSQLSSPTRVFSRLVHQPTVEKISEVSGKTVARPSGILAGGIAAFLGSSFFLWMARHYGFRYNFLLFALFFIGGFFLGLLAELVVRAAKRS